MTSKSSNTPPPMIAAADDHDLINGDPVMKSQEKMTDKNEFPGVLTEIKKFHISRSFLLTEDKRKPHHFLERDEEERAWANL